MPSFREIRDLLLLSHGSNFISEEEFLVLYEEYQPANLIFPHSSYGDFHFDDMEDDECLAEFRVEKKDLETLGEALQIPATFHCQQRSKIDGMEGLCMLLRRFAYPCRYSDMISRFGRPVPVLSMVTNTVLDYIYDTHGHLLTDWNPALLSAQALEEYAQAISRKGSPLQNCFGFIDGTVRPVCRPGRHQRVLYNGHKRVHSLKYQSIALPNGLIGNLYGPVEGRRHDAGMLADSGLLRQLERYAFSPAVQPMCVFGDPAYPLRIHLQAPFRNAALTVQMEAFNSAMSAVRCSVEWLFGDISNYFKFLDFKKNLKVQLSSVGKMYIVCALLRNALTCLYGNSTSNYFSLEPPSIFDYFN
ncbi:uncharacterized protein [Montipora capricornis]|uniref:uncharacterized protein n=1 Tax=Montipora capricornis TaxID=246305 RepID=UPI0035F1610F